MDTFGEILGRALANITCVLDPEIYLIGGGFSKAGDILLDPVRKYYREYAFHTSRNTKIVPASLGNGYMGVRSATEEKYLDECRDTLVAETFDKFSEHEVTELPNAPDVIGVEITLDGERFDLTQSEIHTYERALNIRSGLLTRDVAWTGKNGKRLMYHAERIVSLKRLHTDVFRLSGGGAGRCHPDGRKIRHGFYRPG